MTYTDTLVEQHLWRKASPEEQELIQERQAVAELFSEIADSSGWQRAEKDNFIDVMETAEVQERLFLTAHDERQKRQQEIWENDTLSLLEKGLAVASLGTQSLSSLTSEESAIAALAREPRDILRYNPDAEKLRQGR
ncbi:MAG: hypothetical protein M2R45_03667 [Verrucomicrobia subdivision 3 bacterium]|nr:hypothetical protein [Limisphaerales bacterium]MCS1412704.1 hypothetical protein [Limisphaerales bacterium]